MDHRPHTCKRGTGSVGLTWTRLLMRAGLVECRVRGSLPRDVHPSLDRPLAEWTDDIVSIVAVEACEANHMEPNMPLEARHLPHKSEWDGCAPGGRGLG